MTILHLVRHGQTDWNLVGRVQGTTDIPLNDTGRCQAQDAADALLPLLETEAPVAIVTSDLSRAAETARIIAQRLDLAAPREYPQLRERSYGVAEGTTAEEFEDRFGPWRTAEVPGAERPEQLRRRAIAAVRRVVRDVRRASAPHAASVIVVTHGAFIRELVEHASGGALPTARIGNGGGFTLLCERHRMTVLDDARV